MREIVRLLTRDARADAAAVLDNCDRHLRINPDDLTAHARRALTLVALGRTAEASENLLRLQTLSGELRDLMDQLVRRLRRE